MGGLGVMKGRWFWPRFPLPRPFEVLLELFLELLPALPLPSAWGGCWVGFLAFLGGWKGDILLATFLGTEKNFRDFEWEVPVLNVSPEISGTHCFLWEQMFTHERNLSQGIVEQSKGAWTGVRLWAAISDWRSEPSTTAPAILCSYMLPTCNDGVVPMKTCTVEKWESLPSDIRGVCDAPDINQSSSLITARSPAEVISSSVFPLWTVKAPPEVDCSGCRTLDAMREGQRELGASGIVL